MIELEKTYLAKYLPEGLSECKKIEIVDIYIPMNSIHPTLRIRKQGNNFEITKKEPIKDDASEQREHTIPLRKDEFEVLSKLPGKRSVKTRYLYPYRGRIAEVDVFKEKLKGLVTVDFEFKKKETKDAFEMPDFCLADVTHFKIIAGGKLCGKSYSDIKDRLDKYKYKKL